MFKNLKFKTIFLYITERCDLACDYCYFKDKRARTLDPSLIDRFLKFVFENTRAFPDYFEISGGEPLLEWELLKKTTDCIQDSFPGARIGVQTNCLAVDKEKIAFFKKNRVSLEIGIDGDAASTIAHRRGMTKKTYTQMLKNIRSCLALGLDVSCTMTVHPREVRRLAENFNFLRSLGIRSIDVTPAAFMNWRPADIRVFKEGYDRICRVKDHVKNIYREEDIRFHEGDFLDLSLHPPHYVFCGDVFLCLPEEIRQRHSLLSFDADGHVKARRGSCTGMLKRYAIGLRRKREKATYRDYVSRGFEIINELAGQNYLNSEEMLNFHNYFKKTHLANTLRQAKA